MFERGPDLATITPLQQRIAGEIVSRARQLDWRPGHHLTEDSLLSLLGTSRTPIRAAIAWLEGNGVLEKRPNRGFFLKALPPADIRPEAAAQSAGSDKVYVAIARDRISRSLPDAVSENELIRRYTVSRAQLRLTLARIASEGWIERRPGRGWAFVPMIDTPEAYQENYRFRQMLEPASMRSPDFRIDPARIERLAAQQRLVREGGYRTMSQVELFTINSGFHEQLAAMGGNRYVVQALTRVNQLRRLIEYGRPMDRERVRRVCDEHLAILAPLKAGDVARAADVLERHLTSEAIKKAIGQRLEEVA
jgi:DNA-binding GntR family transcriptional regulator